MTMIEEGRGETTKEGIGREADPIAGAGLADCIAVVVVGNPIERKQM